MIANLDNIIQHPLASTDKSMRMDMLHSSCPTSSVEEYQADHQNLDIVTPSFMTWKLFIGKINHCIKGCAPGPCAA